MDEMSVFEGGGIEGSELSSLEGAGEAELNQRSPLLLILALCLLLGVLGGSGYLVLAATGSSGVSTSSETESDNEPSGPSYIKQIPPRPPPETTESVLATSGTTMMIKSTTVKATSKEQPTTKKKTTTRTTSTVKATSKEQPTTKKKTTTRTTSTTAKATSPTIEAFSVKELVCTVGASAMVPDMMPPDGLCTYLYYVDVVVVDNKLHAAETDTSWDMFQMEIKSRRKTKGGISFDIQYVTANHFNIQEVKNQLNSLAAVNMQNYGLLTAITPVAKLPSLMNKAKDLLQTFKNLQGSDRNRKAVLAMGIYDYHVSNAFDVYKAQFKLAVETMKADIVIALSSTGLQENDEDCLAAPPSVYNARLLVEPAKTKSLRYPDLKSHATLVSKDTTYKTPHAQMGLSFEIGTLFYKITHANLSFAQMPYSGCLHSTLTHLDIWECLDSSLYRRIIGGMNVGRTLIDDTLIYLWDSETTMRYKLDAMNRTGNMRANMVWLVNNVHLGDYTKQCESDPFFRLKIIRNNLFHIPD